MAISRIATPEPEEDLRIRDSCGGRALTNTWDADSNRVGMNANGTAYAFVYNTTAGIPAVIEESSGGTTVYYIREPGGGLIARVHPTQGIRYYYFDELGSTRLLTDVNGTVTDRYAYDAYGSLLSRDRYTGSVNQPYRYVGQLGYYTHWMEPEFGQLQLGVRFYDAEVGRFAQRDEVPDGVNRYLYAHATPCAITDHSGRTGQDISKDPALQKCLRRIRRCLPEFAGAIDDVSIGGWIGDSSASAAETGFRYMATGKTYQFGCCPTREVPANGSPMYGWMPYVIVGTGPGEPWSTRNTNPRMYHDFCRMILHELIHARAGLLGYVYQCNYEYYVDPDFYKRQSQALYGANLNCLGHD